MHPHTFAHLRTHTFQPHKGDRGPSSPTDACTCTPTCTHPNHTDMGTLTLHTSQPHRYGHAYPALIPTTQIRAHSPCRLQPPAMGACTRSTCRRCGCPADGTRLSANATRLSNVRSPSYASWATLCAWHTGRGVLSEDGPGDAMSGTKRPFPCIQRPTASSDKFPYPPHHHQISSKRL